MNVIYLLIIYTQQNNNSCIMDSEIISNQMKEVTVTTKSKRLLISNKRRKNDNIQKMINNAISNYHSRYKKNNKAKAINSINEKYHFIIKRSNKNKDMYRNIRKKPEKLKDKNGEVYHLKAICQICSKPYNISEKWEQQLLTSKAICRTCQNKRKKKREEFKINTHTYNIDDLGSSEITPKLCSCHHTHQPVLFEIFDNNNELTLNLETSIVSEINKIVFDDSEISNDRLYETNKLLQNKFQIITVSKDDTIKNTVNHPSTSRTDFDREQSSKKNFAEANAKFSLVAINKDNNNYETDRIYTVMMHLRSQVKKECVLKGIFINIENNCYVDFFDEIQKTCIQKNLMENLENHKDQFNVLNVLLKYFHEIILLNIEYRNTICQLLQNNIMNGGIEFSVFYGSITRFKMKSCYLITTSQLETVFNNIVELLYQNSIKLFPQCAIIKEYFAMVGIQKIDALNKKERFILMSMMSLFLALIEFDWQNLIDIKLEKIISFEDLNDFCSKNDILSNKTLYTNYLFIKTELGKILTYILSSFLDIEIRNNYIIMMTIEEMFSFHICSCENNRHLGYVLHNATYFYNISKLFFAVCLVESYDIVKQYSELEIYDIFMLITNNLHATGAYFKIVNLTHFETFEKFTSYFFVNDCFKYIKIQKLYSMMLTLSEKKTKPDNLQTRNNVNAQIAYNRSKNSHIKLQTSSISPCVSEIVNHANEKDKNTQCKSELCHILNRIEAVISNYCKNEITLSKLCEYQIKGIKKIFADLCLEIYKLTFDIYPFSL